MSSIVQLKTIIGHGDGALVVEPRGEAVRIKMRGRPDIFIRYDTLPALVSALAGIHESMSRART